MAFMLTSTAFAHEAGIPARHTCDDADLSPELAWTDPPPATQSFAMIMDDPDAPAGTWVHGVIYDLPPNNRSLGEGVTGDSDLGGGSHGRNSWGRTDYGGPCPPSGTHRYFFRLYALDVALGLEPGATKEALLDAMEGHILAQAELMGTYARR